MTLRENRLRILPPSGDRGAIVALGLVILICVAALLHGGGELYFGPSLSDLTEEFYPRTVFISRWLDRGVFPLWDPHLFGGYPLVETQQPSVLYPSVILPAWCLSPEAAMLATMSLHMIVALVFGYAGFRMGFRLSPWAALLATTTFALGAAFTTRVGAGHFTVVAVCGWYPLAIGCALQAARRVPPLRRRTGTLRALLRNRPLALWLLASAAVNALTVLAGSQQYVVYLFWMQTVAALAALKRTRWLGAVASIGAAWALAAALSAPQWLPTLSYIPFSGRGQIPMRMVSNPLDRLTLPLELLLPFPLGDDLASPHVHMKNIWETASYPGAAALALVVAGATGFAARRGRGSRRPRISLCLIALGLYFCLGYRLPGLGMFREPLKARIVLAFGISLCAALAFERLRSEAARGPRSNAAAHRPGARGIQSATLARWSAVAVLLAAWGIVACFLLGSYPVQILLNSGTAPLSPEARVVWIQVRENPELLRNTLLPAVAAVTLVLGLFVFALAWIRRRPRFALAACLLLACAEPLVWHIRYLYSNHPYPPRCGLPEDVAAFLESEIEATRRAGGAPWRVTFPNAWVNRAYYHDGLLETGGYDPFIPAYANSRSVLKGISAFPDRRVLREPVAQALGRRFNFLECPIDPAARPDELNVFRDSATASIAAVTRSVRPADIPLGWFGPDMNGVTGVLPGEARYVFAETPAEELPDEFRREVQAIDRFEEATSTSDSASTPTPATADREVESDGDSIRMETQRAPGCYDFHVRLRAPALFILRTTWLPGWRVRVDEGPATSPWVANRWTLGAPVGEGNHRIVFEYRPVRFTLSLWTALAAWLIVAAAWIAIRFSGKRQHLKNG